MAAAPKILNLVIACFSKTRRAPRGSKRSEKSNTRRGFASSLDRSGDQQRQMFRLLSSCLSSFCCSASYIDCCCCSVCSAEEPGENCWVWGCKWPIGAPSGTAVVEPSSGSALPTALPRTRALPRTAMVRRVERMDHSIEIERKSGLTMSEFVLLPSCITTYPSISGPISVSTKYDFIFRSADHAGLIQLELYTC